MAIGIRKTPHPSQTRFYIVHANTNPGGRYVVKNITPTPSSLIRFSRLVRSGKFDLFRCETHNVLLKVVIE